MRALANTGSLRWRGVVLAASMSAASACDSGTTRCPSGVYDGSACTALFEVAVNGHGLSPTDPKLATAVSATDSFVVRRSDDDSEAFAGEASGPNSETDANEDAWVLEFTDLDSVGKYYVETDDGQRSTEFRIASNAYEAPLALALLGLYGQRCGMRIDLEYGGGHFQHEACHLAAPSTERVSGADQAPDVVGGWHDAGDYGKYAVNGAFSVAFLLYAWEHFGSALGEIQHTSGSDAEMPGLLAEAAWQLDWLTKMQLDDGGVAHQVRPQQYEGTIRPDADPSKRYLSERSSAATADVAAAMALGSRVFQGWDPERAAAYRGVADRARNWLLEHPEPVVLDQSFWPNSTYDDDVDRDERLWANVEWWRLAREASTLAEIEEQLEEVEVVGASWDWRGVAHLGIFAYLLDTDPARSTGLAAGLSELVVAGADQVELRSREQAYGRGVESYYWGSNGVVARSCMNLLVARKLSGETRFRDACALQIGHLLGRNTFNRSQLTGIGYRPPASPHHRPSQADGIANPWPGLLVGGPNASSTDNPRLGPGTSPALAWFDSSEDYFTNEIAINWNAALVYALAGLVAP